ncbi:MAG: hypothetical protein NW241_00690 [Bacteroidia bacterium]|nr:hypothetical protein [Bacteroidia bacterium]
MSSYSILASIQATIDEINRKLPGENKATTLAHKMQFQAMRDIKDHLERLQKQIVQDQFKIFFRGKVGVGKTTAICRLLGLTFVEPKKEDPNHVEDVLATAAGRTTICRVRIIPSDSTKIELDPLPDKDIKKLFQEYFGDMYDVENGKKDTIQEDTKTSEIVTSEYRNALKNLANIKSIDTSELVTKHKTSADFVGYMLERANLPRRIQTSFIYNSDSKDSNAEKKWLKQVFQGINYGKEPDCSIPKEIRLYIRRDLIAIPRNIKSVIDTKGLESSSVAGGFSLWPENEASIQVLCSDFNSLPAPEIQELIKTPLKIKPENSCRVLLLGLPKKDEPLQVADEEGEKVADRQSGFNRQREKAMEVLKYQLGIVQFPQNNIIFYDAHGPSGQERKESATFWTSIETAIDSFQNLLTAQAAQKIAEFEEIKKNGGEAGKEFVSKVSERVKEKIELKLKNNPPIWNSFNTELQGTYASTIRALNNRNGIYDMRDIDIYMSMSSFLVNFIASDEPLRTVHRLQRDLKEFSETLNHNQKIWIDIILSAIEKGKDDFVSKSQENFKDYLQSIWLRDEFFWQSVQSEWGNGPGFKHRVISKYAEYTNNQNLKIDAKAKEIVSKNWKRYIEDVLINYLS